MLDLGERIMQAIRDHEERLRHLERAEYIAQADMVDGLHASEIVEPHYVAASGSDTFTDQAWTNHDDDLSVAVVAGDTVLAICAFDWAIDAARDAAAAFRLSIGGTTYGGGQAWAHIHSGKLLPGVVLGVREASSAGTWTVALQVYTSEAGRTITVGEMHLAALRIK